MLINRQFLVSVFAVLVLIVTGSRVQEISTDIGRNVSVPCWLPTKSTQNKNVMWVRDGKEDRLTVQEDGSLFLTEVDRSDSGNYTCTQEGPDGSDIKRTVRLKVRTPPPLLLVTVHPSTILALILWTVEDNGGYPIICFTAQYRLANSDEEWKPISPNHISPNSRQVEVYKLEPNTTYAFRVWAVNQLGKGEVAEAEGHTLCNNQELELARHFLEGADKFDTRMWLIAVGIVMGTLVLLAMGTCLLLYQECRTPSEVDDQEVIELVPNIILNPGFDGHSMSSVHTEHVPPDENCNSENTTRLNNNTVIQPRNV